MGTAVSHYKGILYIIYKLVPDSLYSLKICFTNSENLEKDTPVPYHLFIFGVHHPIVYLHFLIPLVTDGSISESLYTLRT